MKELPALLESSFGINKKQADKFVDLFESESIKKSEFYLEAGRNGRKLSFIETGYLRVFNYADGKDITQWVSSKGDFITDLSSLIFKTAARWNIQALTDCTLYTVNESNYEKINDIIPNWEYIEKQFIAKCFLTLEDRVFSFLSMTAEDRYLFLFTMNSEMFNHVPHHYLASMLGMTPETFSRIRKKAIS